MESTSIFVSLLIVSALVDNSIGRPNFNNLWIKRNPDLLDNLSELCEVIHVETPCEHGSHNVTNEIPCRVCYRGKGDECNLIGTKPCHPELKCNKNFVCTGCILERFENLVIGLGNC